MNAEITRKPGNEHGNNRKLTAYSSLQYGILIVDRYVKSFIKKSKQVQ